jgi:SecD/SecF fusion protein
MALVVGVLAGFNATLTLSGIAGLVLTLGMAVDANVLIYERIREERKRGLGPIEAINEGFNRATETILDANITTLLTAFILYLVGQGPVQGFAITLSAGIIASVLASLLTTRALFSWFADRGVLRELKMLDLIGTPTISYTAKIKACAVASVVVIAAGMTLFISRGSKNLGLDFASGTLIQFVLGKEMPIDEVRSRLAKQEAPRPDGQGTFYPYANAEIVEVHSDMTGLGSATNRFNLRTEITAQKAVKADVEKVFAGELASSGFAEMQRVPEGVSWKQVYALRVSHKWEKLHKEVVGVWEGRAEEIEAAGNPKPEYKVERTDNGEDPRVKEIQVSVVKRPWRTGETRASLEADLKAAAADVKKALEQSYLDPAAELVSEQTISETFTVRLPCSFRIPVPEKTVRKALESSGYRSDEVQLETAEADKSQQRGDTGVPETHVAKTTFVMTGLAADDAKGDQLEGLLRDAFRKEGVLLSDPFPQITKIDPVVAGELQRKGANALLMAMIVIVLYVAVRFRAGAADTPTEAGGFMALCRDMVFRARFGLAAIVAIAHDVMFSLGAIAAADQLGIIEAKIDLPMLAALLAIVGYSLNDSIVVFDRVRENLRKNPDMPLRDLIDLSVNQTMSRTLMTSTTTLAAVTALLVFGAGSTQGFAFAMLCGVGVGTYSSIFIASPLLLLWEKRAPGSGKAPAPVVAGLGGAPDPKPAPPAPAPEAPADTPAEGGG